MNTADYDFVSDNYDQSRSAGLKDSELLFELLNPLSGASILEVGCGTGNYLKKIYNKSSLVTGLDISRNMLLRTKSKLPGINLIRSNAECLPFPNKSFDAIYSIQVLHHINDKSKLMSEVYRTLKKGGKFVLQICTYEQLLTFCFYYYFTHARDIDFKRFPSIEDIYQKLSFAGFKDISSHLCNIDDAIDDSPSAYLEKYNRDGCSSFAFLSKEEVEEGCKKVNRDIKSGKVTEVIADLQNKNKKIGGNATFIKCIKPYNDPRS